MAGQHLRLLTASDLPALFPAGLLAAAEDYLVAERLRRSMAAGDRLAAVLEGFRADYEVTAYLTSSGAECTCTCGARQPCRHAAALVAAWVQRRSWFVDLDELLRPLAASKPEDLLTLLGRIAVEPDDRLAPLLEAVKDLPSWDWPVPPGRWVEGEDLGEAVGALAGRWDRVVEELRQGNPQAALASLLTLLEAAGSLALRVRDTEGLLARFVSASVAQVASLVGDQRLGEVDRRPAADRLLALVIGTPVDLAMPAADALASVAGQAPELLPSLKAGLLAELWRIEAAQSRQPRDPAADLRQNVLVDALTGVLLAAGQPEDALAALAQFPQLWRATSRRIAELRRLGRVEEALRAVLEGLATAHGQAALDLHRWAGELLLELGRPEEAVPHLLADYLGRRGDANLALLRHAAKAAGTWSKVRLRLAPPDEL